MSTSATSSPPQTTWPHHARWFALLLSVFASVGLLVAGWFPFNVPDTYGHLAQGRQIVELGRVPRLDTWSLLEPPREFYNYEWLSDVLFYGVMRGLGDVGLTVFKGVVLAATAWALCRLAGRLGGYAAQSLCAALLIAAIPASRFRLTDRPHVLGMLFAAVTLLVVTTVSDAVRASDKRQLRRALAVLAVLHVVWVNCHGSHLLGLAITGCFVVCVASARRELAAALLVQGLASCVSPYGPYILIDAVDHVLDPRYRALVSEWQPWSPDARPWYQVAPVLQGGALALLGPHLVRRGERERALLLLSAGLSVLSFRSMRFVSDFLLFTSPLLAAGIASRISFVHDARVWVVAALGAGIGAVTGARALPPGPVFGAGASYEGLPAASGAWLAKHMPAPRVFGAMEDTWFLMYAAPQVRVYIDGRVPFYGADFVQAAQLALFRPHVFEQVAADKHINAVVLRYVWDEHRALLEHLIGSPAWQPTVIEDEHVTFVRTSSLANAPDLRSLRLVYRYDWVFDAPDEQVARMEEALTALSHPNSAAYVAWVRALISLRPSLRAGSAHGLSWPTNDAERARFRAVLDALERHRGAFKGLRHVSIIEGLVATLLNECERAEAALREASDRSAGDRSYLMALAELSLRQDGPSAVADFVARHGGAESADPWVADLARALANPPRCNAP